MEIKKLICLIFLLLLFILSKNVILESIPWFDGFQAFIIYYYNVFHKRMVRYMYPIAQCTVQTCQVSALHKHLDKEELHSRQILIEWLQGEKDI